MVYAHILKAKAVGHMSEKPSVERLFFFMNICPHFRGTRERTVLKDELTLGDTDERELHNNTTWSYRT